MKKESGKKQLYDKLQAYVDKYGIKSRGPLSVVLIITRKDRSKKPPFSVKDFLTPKGGQVAGLSGSAVQKILNEHGISRILAEEGGRTSRGSIRRMEGYIKLLNDIATEGFLDFPAIESWWIDRVKEYFASEPFKLKLDPSKSLRRIVGELINAAFKRQEECPGTMTAGAVMQHL